MADESNKHTFGERFLSEAMEKAGVKTDEQGNLGCQDALRLKHSLNRDIRYCGLNAQEITEKKKVTQEQWAAARKWYSELVQMYDYDLHWFWYIVAVALGVYYFGFAVRPWRLYTGVALALVIVWIVGKLARLRGFNEGFFIGYENGFDAGINRLLGIDQEESLDIHERATEMEIDEGLIAHLDKSKDAEKR